MEEDRLLRFHERLKDFVQKHLTLLLNIVLFFVIVIVLAGGWVYYQRNKEKKAYLEFLTLIHKRAPMSDFQNFVKRYGSTQAGLQASLLLWENVQGELNYQEMANLLKVLKKVYPGELKDNLFYAEAKLYEERGEKIAAKNLYAKVKSGPLKRLAELDLARLTLKENPGEAVKHLEAVRKDFNGTLFQGWAEYKLQNLKGS